MPSYLVSPLGPLIDLPLVINPLPMTSVPPDALMTSWLPSVMMDPSPLIRSGDLRDVGVGAAVGSADGSGSQRAGAGQAG